MQIFFSRLKTIGIRTFFAIRLGFVCMNLFVRKSVLCYWARICVWGNDDCGMEKDFELSENEKIRLKEIKQILKEANDLPNPLNKDWLLTHGFKYA